MMIETNNPEINVDELMARIQEEVARQRASSSFPAPSPRPDGPVATGIEWAQVDVLLQAAEYHAQHVGSAVPEWTHFGRLRRGLARLTARFVLYLSNFVTHQQKQFNSVVLQSLRTMTDSVRTAFSELEQRQLEGLQRVESELAQQVRQLDGLEQTVSGLRDSLSMLAQRQQEQWQRLEAKEAERAGQVERLAQALTTKVDAAQLEKALAIKADSEQIMRLSNYFNELIQQKAELSQVSSLETKLQELAEQKASRTEVAAAATEAQHQIGQKADQSTISTELKEIHRQILDHKRNILDQQRRLALLLEEARKRLPEPIAAQQIEALIQEEDHLLDAFYVSFEDQFRGTREDIKQRAHYYLPIIQAVQAGSPEAPILDVGCGRGEWLELLKENGLRARGIDLNRVMVGQCQEMGLDVIEAEGIAHLRSLKSNSLSAVTGMHIIEHLPFRILIALFDETLRALKPGGAAIFETPNPENLIVGACDFYYDPTHRNPLPPPVVQFTMEARGFVRSQIHRLNEYRVIDSLKLMDEKVLGSAEINPLIKLIKQHYFAAPDYAVIGYKA
jgi:O-antigen chain-terminating methyltransferase